MKVLLSWLREFAPLEGSPDEIGALLTELGLPVEEQVTVGSALDGVVTAKILAVRAHPDADRIRLVDVDAGDGTPLQIVCGAPNLEVDDIVPLATVGAVLPGGFEIAYRKMRGEPSNGMLCSAKEMGLGEDHAGILTLDPGLAVGVPVAEALGLSEDTMYDLDVLPNRPEALCVAGIARDLAAKAGVAWTVDVPAPLTDDSLDAAGDLVSVSIEDTQLCGQFQVHVLSGVEIRPSARWMAQRLLACGMRPINNVVDVSNYVMLELGQPSHAFDLDKVAGHRLTVRSARDGEVLRTLDGTDRTLTAADGVIVDGDDQAVSLAGVMGGESTEISDSTTRVLLEMAWWDPDRTAQTAGRLSLNSEASLRFKRGVDPTVTAAAANRFIELLAETSPVRVHPGVVFEHGDLPKPAAILVRPARVSAVVGIDFTAEQITELLTPLGFEVMPAGDELEITAPPARPDVRLEIDVVEEVARLHGYSKLAADVPMSPLTGMLSAAQRRRRALRNALLAAGLDEAMPMPFLAPSDLERAGLDPEGFRLANPLVADESVLRTSLLPGLLSAVAYNEARRSNDVKLYEIGKVFGPGPLIVDPAKSVAEGRVLTGEAEVAAAILAGSTAQDAVRLGARVLDALGFDPIEIDQKPVPGLHPARSGRIVVGGVEVGSVGEVDPRVCAEFGVAEQTAWLELDLEALLVWPLGPRLAEPVSKFPAADADLAFVVDESVTASALRSTILGAHSLVVAVELFDVFRSESLGTDKKSVAWRVRFQSHESTLSDTQIAETRAAVIDAVASQLGGSLRA